MARQKPRDEQKHEKSPRRRLAENRVMAPFLRSTDVIDFHALAVRDKAAQLKDGSGDAVAVARRCFEWVRDHIQHSRDFNLHAVTCSASQVLEEGSGYCYPKSHLLAALLRANGIPAGLCYQRLAVDDEGRRFCLHGLNAVLLPGAGWYRIDPRGNRAGIDAQFTPPVERLAFTLGRAGEFDLPGVWPDPLPVVIEALRSHHRADRLYDDLPDITMWAGGQGRCGKWV
jgi:transglutaminase-like putative cysteine protease